MLFKRFSARRVKQGGPQVEANQEARFSSLRLIVLLGSWTDISEPPSIPDSLCSSWLLAHCVRTCVFPPVLSWTAVRDSAVVATKQEKNPEKMLLIPKAMNS